MVLSHGIAFNSWHGCILDALTAGTLQMVLIHGIAFNSWQKLPKLKAQCRHSDVFALYILAYIDASAKLIVWGAGGGPPAWSILQNRLYKLKYKVQKHRCACSVPSIWEAYAMN